MSNIKRIIYTTIEYKRKLDTDYVRYGLADLNIQTRFQAWLNNNNAKEIFYKTQKISGACA